MESSTPTGYGPRGASSKRNAPFFSGKQRDWEVFSIKVRALCVADGYGDFLNASRADFLTYVVTKEKEIDELKKKIASSLSSPPPPPSPRILFSSFSTPTKSSAAPVSEAAQEGQASAGDASQSGRLDTLREELVALEATLANVHAWKQKP
jgi:hypothetical protein